MLDPQVPPQLLYGLSVGVGLAPRVGDGVAVAAGVVGVGDGVDEGDRVDVGDKVGVIVGVAVGPAIVISTPVKLPAKFSESGSLRELSPAILTAPNVMWATPPTPVDLNFKVPTNPAGIIGVAGGAATMTKLPGSKFGNPELVANPWYSNKSLG